MSTATTRRQRCLEFDPESGLYGLDGVAYSQLSWHEMRILEDLRVDTFGSVSEQLEAGVIDALPPF
jgi:hypothetical protein